MIKTWQICSGPSELDLAFSLTKGQMVDFTIDGLGRRKVRIEGLRALGTQEDANEEYGIRGYFLIKAGERVDFRFTGCFNSRSRKGFIQTKSETETRVPADGDPAFTKFEGSISHGVLTQVNELPDGRILAELRPVDGDVYRSWQCNPDVLKSISVGYDRPIVWDKAAHKWFAPADS